jgi:hypothetical protein
MKCLKGINSDKTHKQHTLSRVSIRDGEYPVSVDITAATDRIPVKFTKHVLANYFDSIELAEA